VISFRTAEHRNIAAYEGPLGDSSFHCTYAIMNLGQFNLPQETSLEVAATFRFVLMYYIRSQPISVSLGKSNRNRSPIPFQVPLILIARFGSSHSVLHKPVWGFFCRLRSPNQRRHRCRMLARSALRTSRPIARVRNAATRTATVRFTYLGSPSPSSVMPSTLRQCQSLVRTAYNDA